jgi:anti-anti-sigma regulatory factor
MQVDSPAVTLATPGGGLRHATAKHCRERSQHEQVIVGVSPHTDRSEGPVTVLSVTEHAGTSVTVCLDDSSRSMTPVTDLLSQLCRPLEDGVREICVDVSGLQVLSTGVVSVLLGARRLASSRGASVVLLAPDQRSRAMLRRSSLDRVLPVRDRADDGSVWRRA